jgi:RNA polymerase sigma-70 factor (subfamily 1)
VFDPDLSPYLFRRNPFLNRTRKFLIIRNSSQVLSHPFLTVLVFAPSPPAFPAFLRPRVVNYLVRRPLLPPIALGEVGVVVQPCEDPEPSGEVPRWIGEARKGSGEALGRLFEWCRQYLLLVASRDLPADIRGKVSSADLVQETLLKAHDHFDRFRGNTEAELFTWLAQILRNTLASVKRYYLGADKRQARLEVSLHTGPLADLANAIADPGPSPSGHALAREAAGEMARVLGWLPARYRQVIHWRHWERRSFEEIGRLTGRSAGAARQLWRRALEQLEHFLGPAPEP